MTPSLSLSSIAAANAPYPLTVEIINGLNAYIRSGYRLSAEVVVGGRKIRSGVDGFAAIRNGFYATIRAGSAAVSAPVVAGSVALA